MMKCHSFVQPYAIKEEQKLVTGKDINCLEKLGIIEKGLMGYSSAVLLVKKALEHIQIFVF